MIKFKKIFYFQNSLQNWRTSQNKHCSPCNALAGFSVRSSNRTSNKALWDSFESL